jgi:hypothetical protein
VSNEWAINEECDATDVEGNGNLKYLGICIKRLEKSTEILRKNNQYFCGGVLL